MSVNSIAHCVIAAGGKGTRLAQVNGNRPKALTPFEGKPIIIDQIDKFIDYGCSDFHILLGYEGQQVIDVLRSVYSGRAINFSFHLEAYPLGSGGALLKQLHSLPDCFFFTYCDIYFDIDLKKLVDFHGKNNSDLTLVAHPNDHPQDSDLVVVGEEGKLSFLKSHPHLQDEFPGNLVNAAFYIIQKSALSDVKFSGFEDFAQQTISKICISKDVYVYVTHEILKDMGTPERLNNLHDTIALKRSGLKERVIFLDRDGTLNAILDNHYIREPSEIELIAGVCEALKILRKHGYLLVLITNQPIIARGEVSFEQMKKIHDRLDWLLALGGAYLDYKFYCPHHPDSGYDGEIRHLKFKCECRKPGDGMLTNAAKIIDIDLENSWMVGDSHRDIEAGKKFGVKTCLISTDNDYGADMVENCLYEFAKRISNPLS